jgi:DNA-binding CsgD family transcriptional regulator
VTLLPTSDPQDGSPDVDVAELVDVLGSIDERLGAALEDLRAAPRDDVSVVRSKDAAIAVRHVVHELVRLCESTGDTAAQVADVAEDPLTAREREVADLVAQGSSNAEIAARLFISKRTVESHIDNCKLKLGFRTRHQLMAWTLRRDLTHRAGRVPPDEAVA